MSDEYYGFILIGPNRLGYQRVMLAEEAAVAVLDAARDDRTDGIGRHAGVQRFVKLSPVRDPMSFLSRMTRREVIALVRRFAEVWERGEGVLVRPHPTRPGLRIVSVAKRENSQDDGVTIRMFELVDAMGLLEVMGIG